MSVIWVEGFDIYGTTAANLTARGYATNTETLVLAGARTGPGCIENLSGTSGERILSRTFSAALGTFASGVAINWFTQVPSASRIYHNQGIRFGVANYNEFSVTMNNNQGITLWSLASGNLGNSANNLITLGIYYYLEIRVAKNSAGLNTGTFEAYLNGNLVLAISGLNFPSDFTRCALGKMSSSGGSVSGGRFDDWYISDGDLQGDVQAVAVFPNSDGALQDWTLSAGTDGWALIDEAPPVATDYIESSTAGNISDFGKSAIATGVTVKALNILAVAFKSVAGVGEFQMGMVSGGVDSMSASFTPSITGAYYNAFIPLDPATGLAWTVAGLDAAEMRFERTV